MKKITVIFCILLCLLSLPLFAGGKKDGAQSSSGAVVLNYAHYAVGTHLGRPAWEAFYKRFTERYKGQIELKIEELPSDTLYMEKMKVLAASRELPDVVDGKNGIRDAAIANGQAVELSALLAQDPDFRDKVVGPASMAANTLSGGKVYSIKTDSQVIGYYYNTEMFRKAGISPAKTWDEWFSNCEKLKAIGVYPLALMTGENSWTTDLILSAMVASRGKTGETFMNSKHPNTYQTPEMIAGLTDIQRCLQNYTTPDALGALYANAANNFLTEQAAIIANGPWMIADFSNPEKTNPGFDGKVDWTLYPGDGLVTSYAEGNVLCSPPERVQAGWTFLKELSNRETQMDYLLLTGQLPTAVDLEITAEIRQKMPLVAKHADAVGRMKYHGDTFDVVAYNAVVDAFGRYYPELASGRITPVQMAQRLDEAAAGAR
ncbi:MAG: extracellular solute-binding protein [Treponema sp.]|jgi:raffinose/stachyose/melibiose transport system substrate-binding protein|nr:extracellular solute-binding protein [Treponema sp.]